MVEKFPGQPLTISFNVTNTGTIANTFAIGVSVYDGGGNTWDIYGTTIMPQPGTDISTLTIGIGQTLPFSTTIILPENITPGNSSVYVQIYKHKEGGQGVEAIDGAWKEAQFIILEEIISASITEINVS